jgi:hypothetical protein
MKLFYTIIFSLLSATSFSQVDSTEIPPIDTDRPNQTESVNTVPKKWLQFEAGFDYQKNDDVSQKFLLPTLLNKYGLSNRIELRLITTINRKSIKFLP